MPLDLELPDRLAASLAGPLPGHLFQSQQAPELCYGRHQGPASPGVRRAAVMLLLFPAGDQWRVPLTLRPEFLPHHGGQISLPGGQIEADESIEQAARRELHEELGVDGHDLRILGRLSPVYVFASNFLVTPCVATVGTAPEFQPSVDEVADLLTPSLGDLLDPQCRKTMTIDRQGVRFVAPCICYDQFCIWGATNMMLAEFLAILTNIFE